MQIFQNRTISSTGTVTACLISMLALPNQSVASQADALSYHADGACYCTSSVAASEHASTILPTPIGGQSVAQICQRVGTGPGLSIENGIYNHPAYSDMQCGNNVDSSHASSASNDNNCTGLSAPGTSECHTAGPKWDLVAAYAKPAKDTSVAEATNSNTTTSVEIIASETSAVESNLASEVTSKSSVAAVAQATQSTKTSPEDAADIEASAIALIEAAKLRGHTSGLQSLDTVQSEPMPAAAQAHIIESNDDLAASVATTSSKDSPVIGPNNLPKDLTQDDIRHFPEIFTEEIPKPVTLSDGSLTVMTDTNTLNKDSTTVIVIEADGTPRVMTQQEIEKLPLATLEDIDASNGIQQPEQPVTIPETVAALPEPEPPTPEPAAAITTPPPRNTARIFGEGTLDYGYVSLAPTGFDFGGNGAEVEASLSNNTGLTINGNASVVEEYTEASIGVGLYFSPFSAQHSDIVVDAGVEFGQFDLGITDLDDSGGYVRAYLRSRPFRRLELTGGGRYSSFFDGDSVFIATGTLLLTRNVNAFSKVEIGDNDQFSLGIRLFY